MSTALMPNDLEIRQATRYDNMKFKPYEFNEFPQAIPVRGGKIQPTPYADNGKLHEVVIVASQEELDALQGPQVKLVPVNPDAVKGPSRVANEDDIRSELYVQAEQLGAQIDKRWSVERIEAAIKQHVASKGAGVTKNRIATDVI